MLPGDSFIRGVDVVPKLIETDELPADTSPDFGAVVDGTQNRLRYS
jgi:hypothetical protein